MMYSTGHVGPVSENFLDNQACRSSLTVEASQERDASSHVDG